MAKTSAKKGRRAKTTRTTRARSSRARNGGRGDAIDLLKSDHREVERLFSRFEGARSLDQKEEIAVEICRALKTHTTIEEEIFYPAFLEATGETEIHHEAEIEHEGVKHLIEEIEAAGLQDDYFEARVSVLKEMIKHHVNEEEMRGGMFSKAQRSDMELPEIGQQLRERKLELMGERGEDVESETRGLPQRRPRRELRARSS
jgi:hemerythrin superfamily protein